MTRPIVEEIDIPFSAEELFCAVKEMKNVFFLDSSACHEKLGRFSFLGCDPFLVFKSKKDSVTLEWSGGKTERSNSNPFIALKKLLSSYRMEYDPGLPLKSGAVGYFAYDLKDLIEDLPDEACDDLNLPDCILGFYDVVIIRDNLIGKTYLASSGFPEKDPVKRENRKKDRLKKFKEILSQASKKENISPKFSIRPPELHSNFSREGYSDMIKKAKEYIKKGDIYQVNLSQRFKADVKADPAELYLRLREVSPVPFAAYLGFEDVAVLSSSPERFLLKRGRYIETRPIKGTRPRDEDKALDASFRKELIESSKDRAEHIMIVDLERNDLGKICSYGSVFPSETFVLEGYKNVFHLVSTVAGELKEDAGPIDCLLAAFPGGSITGAPKIRSMEIIEELEPVKRSIYTGAIGYISFDGDMDTSIVIRTLLVKGESVYFQVGGGIVADSTPEGEYEETLHKAKGIMEVLSPCKIRSY